MAQWIEAYPSRLLFVMDVASTENVSYPDNFKTWAHAFSYFTEMSEKVIRDNGSLTSRTDVWDKITTIVNSKSTDIQALFTAAKEVSIYVNDAGSMTAEQVAGAVALLKTEIVDAGKKVVDSLAGLGGDVLCPFSFEQCCINEAASDLRVLCGHDACFDPDSSTIHWGLKPAGAFVVDDPCDPATGDPTDACTPCPDVKTSDHTAKYKAYVKAADGQILDYPTINYTIQARNSSDDDWQDIYNLPDALSNVEQSLDLLLKIWGGSKQWQKMGGNIFGEAEGDESGFSVSLSDDGTVVAIGAPRNSGGAPLFPPNAGRGHVRVYAWDGSEWTQRGNDIDGEADDDASGHSVSLSGDGTVVAIGAPGSDGAGSNAGRVKVHAWNGSAWTQRGGDIDGEMIDDVSGWSVSLSSDGTVVAIGATGNDGVGSNAGHVRVYAWDGSEWTQRGNDIDGEAEGDESGFSVSLSDDGTVVAIGAPKNESPRPPFDHVYNDAGHVRVYAWNGSAWVQRGNDIDGEMLYDWSGHSVSLSGDGTVVAIGAIYNDGNGNASGHVRVYAWNGIAWIQRGNDIDGEEEMDQSGFSVSLSNDGTIVAIGSPENGHDYSGNVAGWRAMGEGQVEVYAWMEGLGGGAWVQVGADIEGEVKMGKSGFSVSLVSSSDSVTVAFGSPQFYASAPSVAGPNPLGGWVSVFNFVKSSACHPLISQYGSIGSCEEYVDVPIGGTCSRRVFKRDFRIKAETEGLDAIYSSVFKLYKYIYQKDKDSGSGSWKSCSDLADGGSVRYGGTNTYIYRTYLNNLESHDYKNSPQDPRLAVWPAGNNLVVDNAPLGWMHQYTGKDAIHHNRVVRASTSHYNETLTHAIEFNLDKDCNYTWPEANSRVNAHPCPDWDGDRPTIHDTGWEKLKFEDSCGYVLDGPNTISTNDRASVTFVASGVPPVNANSLAQVRVSWHSLNRVPYAGGSVDGSAVPPRYDGTQSLDLLQLGIGYTLDPVHIVAINPSQPCDGPLPDFDLTGRGHTADHWHDPKAGECPHITFQKKMLYYREKRHVIAVAAKNDATGDFGFWFYKFQLNDMNLRNKWQPMLGSYFSWHHLQENSTRSYRQPHPSDTPFVPVPEVSEGLRIGNYHRVELTKAMFSEDGNMLVAIYNTYDRDAYGWKDGGVFNRAVIYTFRSFPAVATGYAPNGEGYFKIVNRVTLNNESLFVTGAALSCDGNRLLIEEHIPTEEVDAQPMPQTSRMYGNGRIKRFRMMVWDGLQWIERARFNLADEESPLSGRPLADTKFLYRTLTTNWDCSKFSIVANESGGGSGGTSAIQKGNIWTFFFDGDEIKPIHRMTGPAYRYGNEYWPYPEGYPRSSEGTTASPPLLRDRDFRGDISMSLDGKMLHMYTRSRNLIVQGPGAAKGQNDQMIEEYFLRTFKWKSS
jgi:hypothetical protein